MKNFIVKSIIPCIFIILLFAVVAVSASATTNSDVIPTTTEIPLTTRGIDICWDGWDIVPPHKTVYVEGEILDLTGLEFYWAGGIVYTDGTSEFSYRSRVPDSELTVDLAGKPLTLSDTCVWVKASYSHPFFSGLNSVSFNITVLPYPGVERTEYVKNVSYINNSWFNNPLHVPAKITSVSEHIEYTGYTYEKYDETFFKDNFLIYIHLYEAYYDYKIEFSALYEKNDTVEIVLNRIIPGGILPPRSNPMTIIFEVDRELADRDFSLKINIQPGVEINDVPVVFPDQHPIIENGRTFVPVRAVFEQIGFAVDWNPDMRQATLKNDDYTVVITQNSNSFTVNGKSYGLDVLARIVNGRLMVPVRAVFERIGYDVYWDSMRNVVVVTSRQETPEIPTASVQPT